MSINLSVRTHVTSHHATQDAARTAVDKKPESRGHLENNVQTCFQGCFQAITRARPCQARRHLGDVVVEIALRVLGLPRLNLLKSHDATLTTTSPNESLSDRSCFFEIH